MLIGMSIFRGERSLLADKSLRLAWWPSYWRCSFARMRPNSGH